MTTTNSKRTAHGGPRAGSGRPSKGGRPVTLRLSKAALQDRAALAAAWGCDQTATIERALARAAHAEFGPADQAVATALRRARPNVKDEGRR